MALPLPSTAPARPSAFAPGDALHVSVTVSFAGGPEAPITLDGYRFRYAPRY